MPVHASRSSSPVPPEDDVDEAANRRNPRRGNTAKPSYEEDVADIIEDDDEYDSQDAESEDDPMDVDDDEGKKRSARGTRAKQGKDKHVGDSNTTTSRRSARTTKYQASMKEPTGDSLRDLFIAASPEKRRGRRQNAKSPAARHKAVRRIVKAEVQVSEAEEEDFSDEEEEIEEESGTDEEEEFKIQRIVAARSERRRVWREVCSKINTSEIENGSRWFPDDDEEEQKDSTVSDETFEERFLIKWDGLSFLHCSWETQKDLVDQIDNAKAYFSTFFRKSENGLLFTADERCDGDYFDPAYVQIDRILEVQLPEQYDESTTGIYKFGIIMDKSHKDYDSGTGRQFLVKWGNSPYTDSTYEFERDLILNDIDYEDQVEEFYRRSKKLSKTEFRKISDEGAREVRKLYKFLGEDIKLVREDGDNQIRAYQKELADRVFPNGGQLRDYQAEGVSWMVANYLNGRCSLLADEMGLGKTLQTCAYIDILANTFKERGPYLIVAPLSTIEHWKREFNSWTNLNVIVYHGSAENREYTREFEFAYEEDRPPRGGVGFNSSYLRKCFSKKKSKAEAQWMVQVVITTPEMVCTDDFVELTAVEWHCLVVDEAHRLKNHSSKLAKNLRDSRFKFEHILLLTGTPIQNNMTELWTLMNFMDEDVFQNLDDFLEKYGDIKSKEGIDELHETIRPYILRRLKEDVEKSVPPKEETLIEVELTTLQKQYYRALYEKNIQFLHRNKKKSLDGPSLNNLAMQLRKCCNHPFLLNGVEEEIREEEKASEMSEGDFLVKFSGKLVLLDKLLPRLRENGHRVLIFSQFKIMLDILEDYFSERNFKAERIDGSITGKKRQMAIDRFQAPETEAKEAPFIMMLSTRAGGVGINLTAADTCIIFDSDWNPQNDLQAQARCHRIGQTKSVKVYRLLTRKTYEIQMFHMSSLKMGLDQAVLQGFEGGSQGEGALSKEEVEKLLRHGAYDIFNEEKSGTADAESCAFVQQDIDSILERRAKTIVHDNTGSNSAAAGGTFSKASFKAPKTPDPKKSGETGESMDVDIDDPEFWTKMVGEAKFDEAHELSGKKRKRTLANYSEAAYKRQLHNQLKFSDSEESDSDADSDEDSTLSDSPTKKRKKEMAKWGRKDAQGWKRVDAEKLIKALHAFGYGNISWEAFREKGQLQEPDASEICRWSWAVVLSTLRESAEEGVAATLRRVEREAQKKQEQQGKENNEQLSNGGVLAMDPNDANNLKDKELLENQLKKLLNCHAAWLSIVFNDAKRFASSHEPRPSEIVERYANKVGKDNSLSTPPSVDQNALFAQNLWPQLKSRGWKVEQVTSGAEAAPKYIFNGETFKSPEEIMARLRGIHPELKTIVEEVQQSLEKIRRKSLEEHEQYLASLEPKSITVTSLDRLLNQFAPLQLVVDRATAKRVSLTRKLLTSCTTLFNAHDVVRRAENMDSSISTVDRIARSFVIDKRVYVPHNEWTTRHDAVLIMAIAKHGWIEHEMCCRAITEDRSIKWGAPFDTKPNHFKSSTARGVDDGTLLRVANRAAMFLTTEKEAMEATKDFREALVVGTYGLRMRPSTEENAAAVWEVDESRFAEIKRGREEVGQTDEDFVDLPTKKDLVKRAKSLLSKPIVLSENDKDTPKKPEETFEHGYQVLDQDNPSNLLLAEILRGLIRVSFNNSEKRRQIGRTLMLAASNEAKSRIEDYETTDQKNSIEIKAMERIIEHFSFSNRFSQTQPVQSKNVLRAILGMAPVTPKRGSKHLFPPEKAPLPIETVRNKKAKPRKLRERSLRDTGATGDKAISDAISLVAADDEAVSKMLAGKNFIQLSAPETLLLTVVCSQGLPIWTEHWRDLIDADGIVPEKQGPGFQNAISFWGMGQVFEAAAHVWHQSAMLKLESKQTSFLQKYAGIADFDPEKQEARKKLALLEQDEQRKRILLATVIDYKNHPRKLARKCVMLLESIRNSMGTIESIAKKSASKIAALKKTENHLGPFVLEWLTEEIHRWAESLELVDISGRPLSYTAADFAPDPRHGIELHSIAALMDKDGCRAVFAQVAQQSRVREIFLKSTPEDISLLLTNACHNHAEIDEWEDRPSWWGQSIPCSYSIQHDYLILDSLLEYGYSGIEETLAQFNLEQGVEDDPDEKLTRASVQRRANQLTAALHLLDRQRKATDEVQRRYLSAAGSIAEYFSLKNSSVPVDIDIEDPGTAKGIDIDVQNPVEQQAVDRQPEEGRVNASMDTVDLTFD